MFNFLKNLFSKDKPMKIWAFRSFGCPWVKVISSSKPVSDVAPVIGPFRSEVDCEEFCDQSNVLFPHAKKYNQESETLKGQYQ